MGVGLHTDGGGSQTTCLGSVSIRTGPTDVVSDILDGLVFDARCMHCYPEDRVRTVEEANSTDEESDSTDGDSTSEDTLTD